MGRGSSKLSGGGGNAGGAGGGAFDASLRGTNNVKITGQAEVWESIKRTPASYEVLYDNNGTLERQRTQGYVVEQSGRLFGFTDTPGEDGYTITDLKTGLAIDRTHPKTDYYAIGKSRTISGKSGYAVKDALLLFGDRMSHNPNLKSQLLTMEKRFDNVK